jgi:hypothetical protein
VADPQLEPFSGAITCVEQRKPVNRDPALNEEIKPNKCPLATTSHCLRASITTTSNTDPSITRGEDFDFHRILFRPRSPSSHVN